MTDPTTHSQPAVDPALVARVKGILLQPKTEWLKIDGEFATTKSLFTRYAMILAAIGPVWLLGAGNMGGALLARWWGEGLRDVAVIGGAARQLTLDLQFAGVQRQVEQLGLAGGGGHVDEQLVDRAGADRRQHFGAVGRGQGQVSHQRLLFRSSPVSPG